MHRFHDQADRVEMRQDIKFMDVSVSCASKTVQNVQER